MFPGGTFPGAFFQDPAGFQYSFHRKYYSMFFEKITQKKEKRKREGLQKN